MPNASPQRALLPTSEPKKVLDPAAPISAAQAAQQGQQWAELQSEGEWLTWLEFDASQGRNLIRCRRGDQRSSVLTPTGFSVRSRVHEYGGGSYRIANNAVVFVNDTDQGLYWHSFEQPQALTRVRQVEGFRYADLQFDRRRNRIIAVEEQHGDNGQISNRLVAIGLGNPTTATEPGRRTVLAQGADFYSSPRLNADASKLAWVSWDHPHQPWTSTRLWLGRLDADGVPQGKQALTKGHHRGQSESVLQPEFGPDGSLLFLSDRNGWWNLCRYRQGATAPGMKQPDNQLDNPLDKHHRQSDTEVLLQRDAEFCRAPWQLGQQAYVVLDPQRIGCSWWHEGKAELGVLSLPSRQLVSLGSWAAVHSLAESKGQLLAIAEPTTGPGQLVACSAAGEVLTAADRQPTAQSTAQPTAQPTIIEQILVPSGSLPTAVIQPCHVQISSPSAATVYGLLYRPAVGAGQRLPLIIQLHGGPTAQADGRYDPLKQFWLQRGFALLDLNYRGSTGYGRHYREQLQGQWGIADVEDVIAAARFFIGQGWVDPERIVVRGNSAGGYTTLQALSQPAGQQWLRCGASHYGISDLERLASDTHKFESRYLDWLIGDRQTERLAYRSRSPVHRPEAFCRPLIFFQGGLDRVVPATQSYRLYNQLKGRGLAVEYQAFADERHGFRHARNRAQVLKREWAFYCRQLGLQGPDTRVDESNPER
ncbi:MAG: prolyl oligopeptidase family serine peptidase [Motiliproteus sp.]